MMKLAQEELFLGEGPRRASSVAIRLLISLSTSRK